MSGYDAYGIRSVRKDRRPRGTNVMAFIEINKYPQKHGHGMMIVRSTGDVEQKMKVFLEKYGEEMFFTKVETRLRTIPIK